MDSSKLNQDIVLSTGESFHDIKAQFSVRVDDKNLPASDMRFNGFHTGKPSREGGLLMQMSELEKDEVETPGHHVLFPVLSSQSSVFNMAAKHQRSPKVSPLQHHT